MSSKPRVSAIIIFLDEEKFLQEAIESVLAQTYLGWELLLVDDGSRDGSTEIARQYVAKYGKKMRYLSHAGHENRGMSASRNLGIRSARGAYLAFLDADDVWLSNKLERQVEILESHPEAAMVYGNTEYWHSWTGKPEDRSRDYVPELGVELETAISPPELLPLLISGRAAVPCLCSLLVRRETVKRINLFEERFRNMYEDQAFYAKVVLNESVYVSADCLERYRQHPESIVASSLKAGSEQLARRTFLSWLANYLAGQEVEDSEVWTTLRRQLWLNNHYRFPYDSSWVRWVDSVLRWLKKWILRFEERLLPASISTWLWCRECGSHWNAQ